jgi:hypothetical protein
VQQGQLGDCWLLAAFAETAARVPADIQNMFIYDGTTVENGSTVGVYSVRYYTSGGVAQYVTVDTELPAGGGYYDNPVNNVLWVALAEKAYAEANGLGFVRTNNQYCNSYAALNGGGGFYALPAITGKSASFNSFNTSAITTAWQSGQLITLGTNPNLMTALNLNGVNIVHNHEYAVVGYNSMTQQFTLFSPWGVNGGFEVGTGLFCAGFVTGTGPQLATAFVNESIGNGAAPTNQYWESFGRGAAPRNHEDSSGLPAEPAALEALFMAEGSFIKQPFGVPDTPRGHQGRHGGSWQEPADLLSTAGLPELASNA